MSKKIDFLNLSSEKIMGPGTKQYSILNGMSDSEWNSYCNKMLGKGISILYDAQQDAFVAKPLKESNLMKDKKFLLHDEMDMELNEMLNGLEDSVEAEETESKLDIVQEIEKLLQNYLGGLNQTSSTQNPPAMDSLAIPDNAVLATEQEKTDVLGSEFDVLENRIDQFESKIEEPTYGEEVDSDFFVKPETPEVETFSTEEPIDRDSFEYIGSYSSDNEDVEVLEEETPIAPAQPSVDVRNICGMPVKIILTGVMISPSELTYVVESVKKAGFTTKKIAATKRKMHILIENKENKKFVISYEDKPLRETNTPFSIKNNKFRTLQEATSFISLENKKKLLEKKNFEKLVSSDILERGQVSEKESDILKEFSGKIKNTYSGWNVKSVGYVNLKTGLNEAYSNITEHTKESNTLVKTTDGQYYLIKGNLKERSEVGVKKMLVDVQGKKDYGLGTVVGVYENTQKGLGQIMFKTKRTSIPLLVWR